MTLTEALAELETRNAKSLRERVLCDHAAIREAARLIVRLLQKHARRKKGVFNDDWPMDVLFAGLWLVRDDRATAKKHPGCILCDKCGSPIKCYTYGGPERKGLVRKSRKS